MYFLILLVKLNFPFGVQINATNQETRLFIFLLISKLFVFYFKTSTLSFFNSVSRFTDYNAMRLGLPSLQNTTTQKHMNFT